MKVAINRQTLAGIGTSVVIHGVLAILAFTMDAPPPEQKENVPLTLVDREPPPPPPEPEPQVEPEPPKPEPPPPPKEPPKPKVVRKPPKKPEKVKEPPKPPPPPPPKGAPPAYGIKLENEVLAAPGTGVAVPVGDTLGTRPTPGRKPTGKPPGDPDGDPDGEIATVPRAKVQVMPRLVGDSVAEYPAEVRKLGIQGRVVLELVVNGKGRVIRRKVVRSLHPKLDAAAMAAASRLKFKAGTVDGVPIKVKIPYTYVFVLE